MTPGEAASSAGCRGAPPGLPEAFPTTAGHSSINLSRADGKRLSDYSIGPNSKLNLVVKPLEKVLLEESSARTVAEAPPPPPATWPLISKVLARHFSAADASRVLDQLQRVSRVARDFPVPPSRSQPLPLSQCPPDPRR